MAVLALQGDVTEHARAVESAARSLSLDCQVIMARRVQELEGVSGLIMPGGESTTMAKQIDRFGLRTALADFAGTGAPVMGTCAGAVLLAAEVDAGNRPSEVRPLGVVDMTIRRNAFGRQIDSFERPLEIKGLNSDFPGIFIRAPCIERIGKGVESLAALDGSHVMVRQGNIMALTFHPELAHDCRVHGLFLKTLRP